MGGLTGNKDGSITCLGGDNLRRPVQLLDELDNRINTSVTFTFIHHYIIDGSQLLS